MHEIITQVLGYLRGIWRYRWWVLGIAWIVSIIGWVQVAKMPDQYMASARVYVDTQTVLRPMLSGLATLGNDQHRLTLMTRTLMSRPNLEKIMRMADLDLQAKTEGDTERLVNRLRGRFSLRGGGSNLYNISYRDENPELAKLLVKSLLTLFVESNLGDTRKEQDSARQFLEQQIAEYEQRLIEAEARKTRFQQKNMGFLPGKAGGYYARQQQAQNQLAQAELDLKVQQDRLAVLQQQIDSEGPVSDEIMAELLTPKLNYKSALDPRISNLESRLDEMLFKYTENTPDVVASRMTLERLKEQRNEEYAIFAAEQKRSLNSEFGSDARDSNPIYQQIRIAMSEVEADIAAKTAIVNEYKKRIENLGAAVDKVLQVEAEQSQLNRDYGILQSKHQGLLSRLESARLGHEVDTRSGAVRFRIVDPPTVPSKPSGPPRANLSSMVVLAGLGIGLVIAFLLSQIRPIYDNRESLSSLTGHPVLGSISMVWTNAQIKMRRRRHLGFLMVFLVLASAYGFVMFLYQTDVDPVWLMRRLQEMANV